MNKMFLSQVSADASVEFLFRPQQEQQRIPHSSSRNEEEEEQEESSSLRVKGVTASSTRTVMRGEEGDEELLMIRLLGKSHREKPDGTRISRRHL
jgi:hypothetical protein